MAILSSSCYSVIRFYSKSLELNRLLALVSIHMKRKSTERRQNWIKLIYFTDPSKTPESANKEGNKSRTSNCDCLSVF